MIEGPNLGRAEEEMKSEVVGAILATVLPIVEIKLLDRIACVERNLNPRVQFGFGVLYVTKEDIVSAGVAVVYPLRTKVGTRALSGRTLRATPPLAAAATLIKAAEDGQVVKRSVSKKLPH